MRRLIGRIVSWPLERLGRKLFGASFGASRVDPPLLSDDELFDLYGD